MSGKLVAVYNMDVMDPRILDARDVPMSFLWITTNKSPLSPKFTIFGEEDSIKCDEGYKYLMGNTWHILPYSFIKFYADGQRMTCQVFANEPTELLCRGGHAAFSALCDMAKLWNYRVNATISF